MANSEEDKVGRVERIEDRDRAVLDDLTAEQQMPINKDHFDNLMVQEKAKDPVVVQQIESEKATRPSLIDEVRNLNTKVDQVAKVTPKEVAEQANNLVAQIDELKTKLQTPNLEIKSSVQTLLRNKLSHIDESLKIALSKAGVEYVPPTKEIGPATPIERFLGFLTDAQHQLNNLGSDVNELSLKKGNLSPASMMAIQVKVSFVQQQIEFFTSVLNKALESTKTIMNIQV